MVGSIFFRLPIKAKNHSAGLFGNPFSGCPPPHHQEKTQTMYTRRDFIKLSTLFTATAALPLLQACGKNAAMRPDAPLTIG